MRHPLVIAIAIAIIAASCTPQDSQSGAFTQPSVVSTVPIPADSCGRSAAELGAWRTMV